MHPIPLERRIGTAVRELSRIVPSGGAERLYRIGQVIVDNVYSGDLTAWRNKGKKSTSLRALCRRRDLPLSASSVYRGLSIYELVTVSGVSVWKHLKPAHFRAIERAPAERRIELLRYACAVEITPVALTRLAGGGAPEDGSGRPKRRGRPRTDPLVRAIRKLERAAMDVRSAATEPGHSTSLAARAHLAQVAEMLGDIAQHMASPDEQSESDDEPAATLRS